MKNKIYFNLRLGAVNCHGQSHSHHHSKRSRQDGQAVEAFDGNARVLSGSLVRWLLGSDRLDGTGSSSGGVGTVGVGTVRIVTVDGRGIVGSAGIGDDDVGSRRRVSSRR